ncbi:hypothetical protein BC629DRAFT_1565125 [Irpex lacteus]|nr:hypothetical protein BC629DRAFT_1565125 [Irpex lacteus]
MTEGLFRGPLVVRSYKHIFTGPSSAKGATNSRGRKKNQAQLSGVERTTPRTIAYAAVQTRHMLCQQSDWSVEDGQFDNSQFFDFVVALLECTPDVDDVTRKWINATLDWWDMQVFRKGSRYEDPDATIETNDGIDDDDGGFAALIAKRRRAATE